MLVLGSANVDVAVSTAHLPRAGETVVGDSSTISVGGKGANQAVAAARCGAATGFVARVGEDTFGRLVLDTLDAQRVECHDVRVLAGRVTGLATILVDHAGQNCIAVVPGANDALRPEDLPAARIASAAVVVLQCEIPMAAVYGAIEIAADAGTPVILNPAPYRGLDLARLAGRVQFLVPNETEASQICGTPIDSPTTAAEAALRLHATGFAHVIITLGAQGCVLASAAGVRAFAAYPVTAIDATGAGDAFVGCLASAVASGLPLEESVRRAIIYSALSTTRRGAQSSYATATELERTLDGDPDAS